MDEIKTALSDWMRFKSVLFTPLGLTKHFRFFLNKICAFLYHRLHNINVSPKNLPHKGMKQRPEWLMALQIKNNFSKEYFVNTAGKQTLPDCEDNEIYLRDHRWGWLNEDATNARDKMAVIKELQHWTITNNNIAAECWEPYSASERICNFVCWLQMQTIDFQKQVMDDCTWKLFIQESARWIYDHLEYYGPKRTNNHILNNARALILAGVFFPIPHYVNAGIEILDHMLPQLFDQDGELRERSSHYQLLILMWLLDIAWAFRQIFPHTSKKIQIIQDLVSAVAQCAAILCDSRGRLLSLIGDVSPDISPDKLEKRISKYYSSDWPISKENIVVKESKYSHIGNWIRIECGNEIVLLNWPQGKFPVQYPTHGHSDTTSFTWIHEGMEVVCDLGRYRYTADAISEMQKSAKGHNVVLINGLSPTCEPFVRNSVPEPYGTCQLDSPMFFDKSLVLRHNGYKRSNVVLQHERRISLGPGQLTIQDSFWGNGEAYFDFLWYCTNPTGIKVNRIVNNDEICATEILLKKQSYQAWLSKEYGCKNPCIATSFSGSMKVPVTVETIITI